MLRHGGRRERQRFRLVLDVDRYVVTAHRNETQALNRVLDVLQAVSVSPRAIDAGVPFGWFTADEVYGQAKYLHAWLEDRDVSYVLAIKRNDTLTTPDGEMRADALIAAVAAGAWQQLSAGAGAHGPRDGFMRLEIDGLVIATATERAGGWWEVTYWPRFFDHNQAIIAVAVGHRAAGDRQRQR